MKICGNASKKLFNVYLLNRNISKTLMLMNNRIYFIPCFYIRLRRTSFCKLTNFNLFEFPMDINTKSRKGLNLHKFTVNLYLFDEYRCIFFYCLIFCSFYSTLLSGLVFCFVWINLFKVIHSVEKYLKESR